MKFPRPRFTLRWLMVLVAISGLILGGWQMKRRRGRFRGLADKFALRVELANMMEALIQANSESHAKSSKKYAEDAAKEAAGEKEWARSRRRRRDLSGDIDPGIFGGRQPSINLAFHETLMSDFYSKLALNESRRAQEDLEEAGAYAKQVEHYDRLRKKYERASRYPWLLVEPDPPGPSDPSSMPEAMKDILR